MTTSRPSRLRPVASQARRRVHALVIAACTSLAVAVAGVAVWTQPDADHVAGAQPLPPTEPVVAAGDDEEAAEQDDASEEASDQLPLVTYELYLARDPFEPVVPEPEPEPEPDPEVDPTDPDAPVDPADPLDPSDPAAPGVNGQCTSGQEVVCDGRVFSVVEIAEENGELIATLQVDTMRYRVSAGDVVLEQYEVLSVSPEEVRLLVGDRVVGVQVGDNALK